MIGWKEQEPETELSIKHLKLSIAHCKENQVLIFHTLVDLVRQEFALGITHVVYGMSQKVLF